MATAAQTFDLSTSYLGLPKALAYGPVRGAGNIVFQQELADKSRIAFVTLGEGCWDSALRLWVNRDLIALPDARVHFHPGLDGAPGDGLAATSTGGDQKVDAFWASVTGGFDPIPFSRFAYLGLNIPPDPSAPSSSLEILGDYHALKCRQYDNTGAQTAFAWTENQAWWILDFLIRKFIKRSGKINEPLTTAELARFDWQSFSDAAAYYAAALSLGQARFGDNCGLVFNQSGTTADAVLEQMLLLCRSYLLDRNGKISLYADKARASVFTFSTDTIQPGSFKADKINVRPAQNRITANWREVVAASGGGDETRFSPGSKSFDHIAHQLAIGGIAPGVPALQKVRELALDYGINTGERVARLALHRLIRTLGDDVDSGVAYNAPFTYSLVAPQGAVDAGSNKLSDVKPGDLVTIHQSISEEHAGKIFEALEIDVAPDGTRSIAGNEYEANAYPDVADPVQVTEAPDPGDGIMPVSGGANYDARPLSNPVSATDAGATSTVNIASFTERVRGVGDLSINSGAITGLAFNTLYYIYYDDLGNPPTGGTKTFVATTTKETAMNGRGRFFIGSIVTPQNGGADTVGNNDGGAGSQSGGLLIMNPSLAVVDVVLGNGALVGGSSLQNAMKGVKGYDLSVSTNMIVTVDGNDNEFAVRWLGFPGYTDRFSSLHLKFSWLYTRDTGNWGSVADADWRVLLRYSVDGADNLIVQQSLTTVFGSGDEDIDLTAVVLGKAINPGQIQVFAAIENHAGDTWSGVNSGIVLSVSNVRLEAKA